MFSLQLQAHPLLQALISYKFKIFSMSTTISYNYLAALVCLYNLLMPQIWLDIEGKLNFVLVDPFDLDLHTPISIGFFLVQQRSVMSSFIKIG